MRPVWFGNQVTTNLKCDVCGSVVNGAYGIDGSLRVYCPVCETVTIVEGDWVDNGERNETDCAVPM